MRKITLVVSLIISFMIPWEGVIRIPGLGTGVKVMGFVLAICWLATVISEGRMRKPGSFQIVFAVFVLWIAASVFWSADPNRSFGYVKTWAQLLMLVVIWWDLFTTRTAVLAGLQAYVFGAYVSIGSAIANYFAGKVFYSHYQRYSAGETNPDGFGFILALGIPVAWYLASSKNTNRISDWLRSVNYAYIVLAFVGIALSGTRTALIASIVGMIYGLAALTRVRLWVRVAILLLLVSSALYLIPYVQDLRSFQRLGTTATELTEGDLNNRTNNWREGLVAFVEHPILGIGGNMYPTINSWDKASHNTFLGILVELGVIGFALFAVLLLISIAGAWRQPKWEALFWMTVLAVWTIGSSTLTWGHRKPTWLFLSLLIASASLLKREEAVSLVQGGEMETQSAAALNMIASRER